MEKKEKTLKGRTFFIGKINPIEMMTISRAGTALYTRTPSGEIEIDLSTQKKVDALSTYYAMVFEHIYVKISDTIIKPVKEKDVEVWWPESIAEDYDVLFELSKWFFQEVVIPVFLKSSESTTNSDSLDTPKETSKNANETV